VTTASWVTEVELLGTEERHEGVEDDELTSGKSTDHDTARSKTDSGELDETDLTRDAAKTSEHGTLVQRSRSGGPVQTQ